MNLPENGLAEPYSIYYMLWLTSIHCLRQSFIPDNITSDCVIPQPVLVTLKCFPLFQHIWKTFHSWCHISGKFHPSFQGQWNIAKLTFSKLANILSFIPHFDPPVHNFKVFLGINLGIKESRYLVEGQSYIHLWIKNSFLSQVFFLNISQH